MLVRQSDINKVRTEVKNQLGRRVRIKTNRGRNQVDITEGVIKEAYSSIFVVEIDQDYEESPIMTSYTYTDVIIREVCMVLC